MRTVSEKWHSWIRDVFLQAAVAGCQKQLLEVAQVHPNKIPVESLMSAAPEGFSTADVKRPQQGSTHISPRRGIEIGAHGKCSNLILDYDPT